MIFSDVLTIIPPSGGVGLVSDGKWELLSGTNGEDSNAGKLTAQSNATLVVGEAAVRVTWRGVTGQANMVSTTDLLLGPYTSVTWSVTSETCVVYVQSGDAATAFQAWVGNT